MLTVELSAADGSRTGADGVTPWEGDVSVATRRRSCFVEKYSLDGGKW